VANADRLVLGKWLSPVAVLDNDTDADGDPLTVVRVEKLRCGRLRVEPGRRTVAFIPPRAGCARRQRGVYVASDGKAESNRASLFIPAIGAAPPPAGHGRRAAARFTVRIHLSYTDGGVRYLVPGATVTLRTPAGGLIGRKRADAKAVAAFTLTRGVRIHLNTQAVVGDCAAGAPEQLFLKVDGYVTTPRTGPDPDDQRLTLPIASRVACPVPDLP
jgi:hypothetical protein